MSELIVGGVSMAIPVALIWIGMGSAKQMGAIGADRAQKWATKAVKWAARAPFKYSGIEGGAKKGWDNFKKTGKVFGKKVPMYGGTDATEAREAKWAGLIKDGKGGWDKARISLERDKANEQRKKWKDQGGASDDELNKALNGKDASKKKAAALELAEKNGFKNLKQYQDAMNTVREDPIYKNMFEDKVKEKHIKFVIDDHIEKAEAKMLSLFGRNLNDPEKAKIYEKHLGDMAPSDLAKQKNLLSNDDFHKHFMMDKKVSDPRFVQNVAKNLKRKDRRYWKDTTKIHGGYRI